mgnify:CR=1 FL=1
MPYPVHGAECGVVASLTSQDEVCDRRAVRLRTFPRKFGYIDGMIRMLLTFIRDMRPQFVMETRSVYKLAQEQLISRYGFPCQATQFLLSVF